MVEEFRDDDEGYLRWLRAHYLGYVLNAERALTASAELTLHEAGCPTISGQPPRGRSWTGPYMKICAPQKPALQRWAREHAQGQLRNCGTCAP